MVAMKAYPLSKFPLLDVNPGYEPPWGPIGKPVYERTYSRVKEDGSNERWYDTVIRTVDGNLGLVVPKYIEPDEREKLIRLMLPFGIIPGGRHLYASGVRGKQFLFNCHAAGWAYENPSKHFTFMFDQLMQGGGVGSNYSDRYIDQMPKFQRKVDLRITCDGLHPDLKEFQHQLSESHTSRGILNDYLEVDDSREGWVEALRFLLNVAWGKEQFSSGYLEINVSKVRARGLPLKTSGGIACGPGPLVHMLWDVARLINRVMEESDGKLNWLDCMDLDHAEAACVVAGGKRRSSRMAVKNWKDRGIFKFIACKTKDGAHWTTNISVEIDDEYFEAYNNTDHPWHNHARAVHAAVVVGKRLNGEPGFWNRSLSQEGEREPDLIFCPNPCGEIALFMWENCNLGHVNLFYFIGKPKLLREAFRLMARFLYRATNGDIPDPDQQEVVRKNRRIGVGFLGYHNWVAMHGIKYSKSWQDEWVIKELRSWSETVGNTVAQYAVEQGTPLPVKDTTLAPTGTGSLMPGVEGSGQCMIARRFKRLVRFFVDDPRLAIEIAKGYKHYPDEDARNTEIVEYYCENPLVAYVRNAGFNPEEVLEDQAELELSDVLEVQAMFQEHYANNALSFTINLPPEKMPEQEVMEEALIDVLPRLKGTTIFPDMSRKNAPFQRLSKEEWDNYTGLKEIVQIEDECKGGCPVR